MIGETLTTQAQKQKPAKTIRSWLDGLDRYGQRTAIMSFAKPKTAQVPSTVTQLSYHDLLEAVRRLAAGLAHRGLKQGQQAIMFAPNSPEWIISCLSIIYTGATVVPVDAQHEDDAVKHIVDDSKARWIFTDAKGAARMRKLFPHRQLKIVQLDDDWHPDSWLRLMSESAPPKDHTEAEDTAILFYTSGTTGMPKGVPLTHTNILMQLQSVVARLSFLSENDRLLLPLPLFHVYPLNIGLFGGFQKGLPIILPRSLTGPDILHAINEGKATVLVGVPRLLRALYTAIDKKFEGNRIAATLFHTTLTICSAFGRCGIPLGKLVFYPIRQKLGRSLRLFTSGGAPLEANLAAKLKALGWDVAVGYGLTETAPLLTMRMPNNGDLDSVGKPIAGVKIRIARTPDDYAKNKLEGEVEARGHNVFSGYLNLEGKTDEAFTEDHWFKTGDLGFMKHGNLHITGRASSLIVMEGGKKIQPDDLEDKFAHDPVIREIGIFQHEHKLVALVVPNLRSVGGDVNNAISNRIKAVSEKFPSYWRITDFAVTRQPLPRTNLGKIKRHELADLYDQAKSAGTKSAISKKGLQPVEEMSVEDQALLDHDAAQQTWQWLGKQFPNQYITLETSPSLDLNIDSLEWVNLTLSLLEQTGVEISEDAIANIDTVRDLLVAVEAAAEAADRGRGSPIDEPENFLDKKSMRYLKPLNGFQIALLRFLYGLNLMLMRNLFDVSAEGFDDLQMKQSVFVPNHASYVDAFALCAVLPFDTLLRTQWAGWKGIAFANPFNSFMSRLIQTFPIDAKGSLITSMALGAAVLKHGKNLVWFPEGERTLTGELLEFKPGIGLLLDKSDVPVVPVYLNGTRKALPPGDWRLHRTKITVIFGDPVASHTLRQEGEGEAPAQRIADALRTRVDALKPRRHSS